MDTKELHNLLHELANDLVSKDINSCLFILDNCITVITCFNNRTTINTNGLFPNQEEFLSSVRKIAKKHNLSLDWINENLDNLIKSHNDPNQHVIFSSPGLEIGFALPEYIFTAMLYASTEKDKEDIRTLSNLIGIKKSEEALNIFIQTLPSSLFLDATVTKRITSLLNNIWQNTKLSEPKIKIDFNAQEYPLDVNSLETI